MAQSPSHKFGQIIGNLLEGIVHPLLQEFCDTKNLYLDYQGNQRNARKGKKVSWTDNFGNQHDLDYVIEQYGSDKQIGNPLAFIEVAWRRYTKHSRNKAQEIQGAILPLAEKYQHNNPFLGVILAGTFTASAIEQLESLGFCVLLFPYHTMVTAFRSEGIEIQFDEDTPDKVFQQTVDEIENSPKELLANIEAHLIKENQLAINDFIRTLNKRFERVVERILIIPLYGRTSEFLSFEAALQFLKAHNIYEGSGQFRKYEVMVIFSNGDKVEAEFKAKAKVQDFLQFMVSS
ncbi:MAG: DNA methylase [Ardenticatenaceae bacterium]|nr:DNA methylase [Ardenticatenaceae bacterium]